MGDTRLADKPRTVSRERYLAELLKCYAVAKQLCELPLEELAELQARVGAVDAITDPTLYMLKGQALEEDRRVVDMLRRMKREILKEIPHIRKQLPLKLKTTHYPGWGRTP